MKQRLPILLTLVWLGSVSFGLSFLAVYDNTPGTDAGAPDIWPAASTIPRRPNQPVLILFAHPQCPCTRASLQEFAELTADCGDQVKSFVLFLQPETDRDDWSETDLWRSAKAIPGVTVLADEATREAQRFQATTSGHVVLYDGQGKLRFSGGITASRGHAGDNAGSPAIREWLGHGAVTTTSTPVFGCSLLDPVPETMEK
jgi:hypothetical protein